MRPSTPVLAVAVVAACGRVHFGTRDAADGSSDDGARDTAGGADATIDPDLIAWYPMDGDPSLGALDATGHGFDGACNVGECPTTILGIHGSAFHFDGVNDVLLTPYAPAFDARAGTLTMWIRSTVPLISTQTSELANKPFGGTTRKSWEVFLTGSPTMVQAGADAVIGGFVLFPNPPFDTWFAVAFSWGASFKLYIDGVERASCPFTPGFDAHGMYLGAGLDTGVVQYFLAGDMDDVRVFRRALTAPEIFALSQP